MSEICVDDIQTMVMVAEDKARKQGALEEIELLEKESKLINMGKVIDKWIKIRKKELEGAKK